MRAAPPTHRLDGLPVYIPEDDTAWNWERINAEAEALPPGEMHAVTRYMAGDTRFRVDAVAQWLDVGKAPERWHLKRPPPEVWSAASSLFGWAHARDNGNVSDGTPDTVQARARAQVMLVRWGIRKIENSPVSFDANLDGSLTESCLDAIQADMAFFSKLSRAILVAFLPLTEAEKKA